MSNATDGNFFAHIDEVLFEKNRTMVRIEYEFGEAGTYKVDFDILVKIYERTILGYIPREEVRVPIEAVMYHGP